MKDNKDEMKQVENQLSDEELNDVYGGKSIKMHARVSKDSSNETGAGKAFEFGVGSGLTPTSVAVGASAGSNNDKVRVPQW